ncbi:ubiquitin carboxyl-terminal hydrolase, partial [Chlamydoabsidia padenii]
MGTRNDPKKGLCAPWCLVESLPENFAAMAKMYGVQGVEFGDVYDIDSLLDTSTPIHGLILSYAIDPAAPPTTTSEELDPDAQSIFFSCQIVTNVCATSALLGVLLNVDDKDLVIGEELKEFKKFTKDFSPVDCGMAVANSELLKKAHNTFANFETKYDSSRYPKYEDIKPKKRPRRARDDDGDDLDYHFVAFIPANGYVWELDGFNKVPIKLHKINGNWLEHIVPDLQGRMRKYNGVGCNLLSISKATSHTETSHTETSSSLSSSSSMESTTRSTHTNQQQQQQQQQSTASNDLVVSFYNNIILRVEGYLDAKYHNWRSLRLDQLEKMDEITAIDGECRYFEDHTEHQDQIIVELLNSISWRADLISRLKIRNHALTKLIELKSCNTHTPPVATNHVAESKDLVRRQHNYENLIREIFIKLQDGNLINTT